MAEADVAEDAASAMIVTAMVVAAEVAGKLSTVFQV